MNHNTYIALFLAYSVILTVVYSAPAAPYNLNLEISNHRQFELRNKNDSNKLDVKNKTEYLMIRAESDKKEPEANAKPKESDKLKTDDKSPKTSEEAQKSKGDTKPEDKAAADKESASSTEKTSTGQSSTSNDDIASQAKPHIDNVANFFTGIFDKVTEFFNSLVSKG
ncbi:hypothetical protein BB561_003686 [Smittium simulii]|uniref:Uncharacterized protein n=1 Tax=Smittium simulii TaxID=133385 RepID=A0A2T9YK08_9FUNG|nr:hypothetical protein BB561_003686 [Smittium simulii]